MKPTYAIARWQELYEVRDSKRIDGPLHWVAVPTKQDGLGFRRVAAQKDRSDLFAAFVLMLEIAARQDRADRGKIMRQGQPLDAEDLADMTGWPKPVFERALAFFSDPKMGWLAIDGPLMGHNGAIDEPKSDTRWPPPYPTGHNTTTDTSNEVKVDEKKNSSDDEVEAIYKAYPKHVEKIHAIKMIRRAAETTPLPVLLERTKAFAAVWETWPKEDQTMYTKNPGTWFNKGCYLDEPEAWKRFSKAQVAPATPRPLYRSTVVAQIKEEKRLLANLPMDGGDDIIARRQAHRDRIIALETQLSNAI